MVTILSASPSPYCPSSSSCGFMPSEGKVYAPKVVLRMHVISLPLLVNSFSVDVIARGFFWCNNTLWAEGDI